MSINNTIFHFHFLDQKIFNMEGKKEFADKIVIVTGGGQGIGRQIVQGSTN